MPANHDLAIRWSDNPSSVRKLERSGGVPVHGFPRHFRCPGGIVAIVSRSNNIQLTFRATAIDGPTRVTLANGKSCLRGYIIRCRKGTMRRPTSPLKAPVRGWHAIGAFRYFKANEMRAILVGEYPASSGAYIEDSADRNSGISFRPHVGGIPGLPHTHPEATLVDQYVSWIGEDARFGHNYIREAKLYVDLFDRTHWQLLEAKVSTSRETIRMAIGQLRDYRRYYQARHPSLAVLLSSRPSASRIKLLTDNRITVIWRTAGGSFNRRSWQGQ
jgi:hypothetical protein